MSSKYNYVLKECPEPRATSGGHYRLGDCLLHHEEMCKIFVIIIHNIKILFVGNIV